MQTDSSALCEAQQKQEKIILEFPTELIPDEYKHENGSNGQVYIFYDNKGIPLAKKLEHSLKVHQFDIPSENVVTISQTSDVVKALDKVPDENFTENSCLILIIVGGKNIFTTLLDNDVTLKIWSPFINNTTLKYKPKIFMFYEYEEEGKMRTDSFSCPALMAMQQSYDVPSEADVLIVYQKSTGINLDKQQYGFLDNFSKNVERFGMRDDIIGLLTRTEHTFRPVIISTLRKKFYLTSSRYREHYFDILSNGENVLKELEIIINTVKQQKREPQRKNAGRIATDSITKKSPAKLQQNQQATDKSIKKNQLVKDGSSSKNHLESDGVSNKASNSVYNISKKEKSQCGKVWKP